jgi:hypothetical protein
MEEPDEYTIEDCVACLNIFINNQQKYVKDDDLELYIEECKKILDNLKN